MRPLRLKLKGFTAFRDQQDIDFQPLEVFAITGPTGSGKSSLLDAVTFALYGYCERVGKQVGQLVSQGQPRMAVELEFAVGDRAFRITRSTPASKGQTKILLERLEGDEWVQAGEGADRVHECNALIRELVGLDYQGFTRSVLLPQGKFHEFLSGEVTERRQILVDLLGLTLFKRMAERAGQIARDGQVRAQASRDLLEREYEGATREAVALARRTAKEAAARQNGLAKAGEKVAAILDRWEEAQRSTETLRDCAREAGALAATAREAAAALEDLAARGREAAAALVERTREADLVGKEAAGARLARERAEAEWGRAVELAGLRARAEALADMRGRVTHARTALEAARESLPAFEGALASREAELKDAAAELSEADSARDRAESLLEEARHAEQVADLVAGLKPGDPCPVCGTPMSEVPTHAGGSRLAQARVAFERAEAVRERADRLARECETARDRAERDLRDAKKDVARLAKELAAREEDAARTERELAMARAFGGRLPEDPVSLLDERIGRLEELAAEEQDAGCRSLDAGRARADAEAELKGVGASVTVERARLDVDPKALFDRARRAGGSEVDVPRMPARPAASSTTDAVGRFASTVAERLDALAAALGQAASRRAGSEPELLEEAARAAGDLVAPAGDLRSLAASVTRALQEAVSDAAAEALQASDLAGKLERRGLHEQEAREAEERAERFRALAAELRADRLIDFLQREALTVLALGASKRLAELSEGRYRLECRGDEFFVVDTWNGDETRSVKTLSGGETFLASLALALALSEQVRSLSVTERARLDSLFLDEGFGTLDPDSLRVVIEAIEQLGGDGRLVGVITHVPALGEEFPRFQVDKTPRGSTVRFVP